MHGQHLLKYRRDLFVSESSLLTLRVYSSNGLSAKIYSFLGLSAKILVANVLLVANGTMIRQVAAGAVVEKARPARIPRH